MFNIRPFKRCPKCGETKLATREFWTMKSNSYQWCAQYCRPCSQAYDRANWAEHAARRPARPSAEVRFWAKVDKGGSVPAHRPELGPCWIWTAGCGHFGYGHFCARAGDGHTKAHRYSWELHRGPVPEGLWVLHRCDNPPCVRPDHLFLGNHAANTKDMLAKGRNRVLRGDGHQSAILNEARVTQIRRLYENGGVSQAQLARRFGVHTVTIHQVVRCKTWTHVL